MKKALISISALLLSLASVSALATTAIDRTTTESSTLNNVMSDTAITAAVKAKYLNDPKINGLDIHIETINGKVTLTGVVPSGEIHEKAILIAKATDGVKDVISKLEIRP